MKSLQNPRKGLQLNKFMRSMPAMTMLLVTVSTLMISDWWRTY